MIQLTPEEQHLKQFLMDYATEFEIDNLREYLQDQDFDSADVIIEQILKRIE